MPDILRARLLMARLPKPTLGALLTSVSIALIALLAPLLAPSVAFAEDDPTTAVTWSVRPGDANGADGRSWIELTLDPGEQITEHMVVVNHSRQSVEFALSAADGYFTETGRFNMLPSSRESSDAGLWIDLPPSIALEAGGSAVVPFTVTVPDDATPGDHPAGVAAGILSTDGSMGVESRVGFRVMTRVTGELAPSLAAQVDGTFLGSINPFRPGSITVDYRVENTGNMRLGAAPTVTTSGPFGLQSRERGAEPIAEFAPGEHRAGSVVLGPVWPFFVHTVQVSATATPAGDNVPFAETEPAVATITVVAIPWSQLVVLTVAVVLVLLWWRGRRRQQKAVQGLLEEAREQGRQEAAREHGTASAVVIAVASVVCFALIPPPAAHAEAEDSSGVTVTVEITPTPTSTPTEQPTDDPTGQPTPTDEPTEQPTVSGPPELGRTGGAPGTLILAGSLLLVGGIAAVVVAGRARRHR